MKRVINLPGKGGLSKKPKEDSSVHSSSSSNPAQMMDELTDVAGQKGHILRKGLYELPESLKALGIGHKEILAMARASNADCVEELSHARNLTTLTCLIQEFRFTPFQIASVLSYSYHLIN